MFSINLNIAMSLLLSVEILAVIKTVDTKLNVKPLTFPRFCKLFNFCCILRQKTAPGSPGRLAAGLAVGSV